MTTFKRIEQKLQRFIRKYYINEILRGAILFLTISLLYFLITVGVEYFLWLGTTGRTILFWLFVTVQLVLLIRFIGIPLARLIKLFGGIDFRDASYMIGTHFPEVSDKLTNVLQLHKNGGDDELTWASIEQKSKELEPIPFSLAIDFKGNIKYVPYLAIPIVAMVIIAVTGNYDMITSGATRVADYKTEYIPPAPFTYDIDVQDLQTLALKDHTITVRVLGNKIPESASIVMGDKSYYLIKTGPDTFSYTFKQPVKNTPFYILANQVRSMPYELKVIQVPTLQRLQLSLDYPGHTGKKDEIIESTGSVMVPQGTRINWKVTSKWTDEILWRSKDQDVLMESLSGGEFAFAKAVSNPFSYQIITSNKYVKDYESLSFKVAMIEDEYPEINVQSKQDSINDQWWYYKGVVADDYGVKKVDLVYYNQDLPNDKKRLKIKDINASYDTFFYSFPGDLDLEEGVAYNYYFEVTDNDAVNNFKSTSSSVYGYKKLSSVALKEQQLKKQKASLNAIEEQIKSQEQQQKELDRLAQEQVEKKERGFNDKKKLEKALDEQLQQEQKMREDLRNLSKQLDLDDKKDDPTKKSLKERLEQTANELKKNEELLKELQEYQEKMPKKELKQKLDKAQKSSKQQKRSLKQLLELTKRFYVKRKYEQLGEELEKLAEKQQQQSEKQDADNNLQDQERLNEEFKKWQEELKELDKENEDLKKPMDLNMDPQDTQEIQNEQQSASDALSKKNNSAAKSSQKKAAQKMRQKAQQMKSSMSMAAKNQIKEDATMIRQILDNLVIFSLEQESVLQGFKNLNKSDPNYGKRLKVQKDLERAFRHVDDSLFAVSLRNPKVGMNINKEVTDVYYYIEKALVHFSEFEISQGVISQNFILKGANQLAVMLSDSLDAINNPEPMPGEGQGSGDGFQLPDIIKKQESLMKGQKPGGEKSGGDKGSKGQEGSSGSSGQQGSSGEQGESGQQGQQGSQGSNGGHSGNGESGEGADGTSGNKGGSGEGEGSGDGDGSGGSSGSRNKEGSARPSYRESEEESKRVYEIYKQQMELRNQLEDMIRREGLDQKVQEITDRMKSVERKLLDTGFSRDVQNQMQKIMHDLLKLQDASLQQGKEEERESTSNQKRYQNTIKSTIPDASKYFDNKEILNRQVLPLQTDYRQRVKEYFKNND